MENKARIDFKSPRFFIWKAIQYIVVMPSGVKRVIPTYIAFGWTCDTCNICKALWNLSAHRIRNEYLSRRI